MRLPPRGDDGGKSWKRRCASLWGEQQQSIAMDRLATSYRPPHRHRRPRQRGREEWTKAGQDGSRATGSRHRKDEANRSPELLCQRRALELGGAQLGLEVHQQAFHLDVEDLILPLQNEIGGASISGAHRVLEPNVPRSVSLRDNGFHRGQLTAVTQRDSIGREEPDAEVVPSRRG